MASASLICLIARATFTKSWLRHQQLSHLNLDTINNLAKFDLIASLLKFKYHKEHLCPSCEQGKSKKASHQPKPVPNSKQRLHLLHTDLCGLVRVENINEKRYVLVIVDDYSLYTWAEAIATACYTKNRSIIHHRFNKIPYMLINGRKPYILFLHVLEALSYPKNDREDLRKLGVKDSAPTPINSSSHATYIPNTSQNVDELEPQPQHDSIESSSHYVDPSNIHTSYQTYPQEYQLTKDHPLEQAMTDPAWIDFMQEELLQFKRLNVWGMEAIRLFLAYTTHKSFIVFQMDMKTTFLHGTLKEGVYVCLPKGFIDADHPSHVYKLKKALYGLKQAPRAWYDELSKFLLQNHFFKGIIDPTLFIRHFNDDILV
nr:copia protein [Tanacetum cinerariifolium]